MLGAVKSLSMVRNVDKKHSGVKRHTVTKPASIDWFREARKLDIGHLRPAPKMAPGTVGVVPWFHFITIASLIIFSSMKSMETKYFSGFNLIFQICIKSIQILQINMREFRKQPVKKIKFPMKNLFSLKREWGQFSVGSNWVGPGGNPEIAAADQLLARFNPIFSMLKLQKKMLEIFQKRVV